MNITAVWDIEGALETACNALFADLMTALSTQDPQTFQKDWPRVEVVAQLGAGRGQLMPSEVTGLEMDVENCFRVNINADLITDADMVVHKNFRALVRHMLSRLPVLINPRMIYHNIDGPMRPAGTTQILKPDEGTYITRLVYTCDVSVLESAWSALIVIPPVPPTPPPVTPAMPEILTDEAGNIITDESGASILIQP